MEQNICTIQLRKLLQLNEKYFSELVGLDHSVQIIYEKAGGDYEKVLVYIQEYLTETQKKFQEALVIIIGLGDENHLPVLQENLLETEDDTPINLAAGLYFAKRSAAKQLYKMLLPDGNGMVFYCKKITTQWEPSPDGVREFEFAVNHHLKERRQKPLSRISCSRSENCWRFLLLRKTEFIGDGAQQEMTGCIRVDFVPAEGVIRLYQLQQSWLNITLSTLFGVVFFEDWTFFKTHKSYSLSAILDYGLTIPSSKSPIKKMIAQSVSMISGLGIVSNFMVRDCDHYLRVIFGRNHGCNAGNEFYSITLQVIFARKSGSVKIYHDRLESELRGEELMYVEECLFAGNIIEIDPEQPQCGKSFWAQMPFIAVQQSLSLGNWHRVLDGCVDIEKFQAHFLVPQSGIDNIACCRNSQCGNSCMTDVFHNGDRLVTICVKNHEHTTPIDMEDVLLHHFRQDEFNRLLAKELGLKSESREVERLTWDIGVMTSGKLRQCRVVISFATADQLIAVCMHICLTAKIPTVILASQHGYFTNEHRQLFEHHQVKYLPLGDYIGFDFDCHFHVSEDLRNHCFPQKDAEHADVQPITVPSGTCWEEVVLKFIDNHTLVCVVGTESTVRSFWNCGMADRRSDKPDKNWLLLLALAETRGAWKLDWRNSNLATREQQRKKLLCAALKKLFSIPGDPIVLNRDNIAYHCRFQLRG